MCRNLAKEAQGICLMATFLVLTGECQRLLGKGVRLLQTAGQQIRLPQGDTTECLKVYRFHSRRLFHCLCEQWQSVDDTSAQGILSPQSRSHPREKEREVRFLTDTQGLFEPGERPG